jgi:hypothetical protein
MDRTESSSRRIELTIILTVFVFALTLDLVDPIGVFNGWS